ncbi:hypothetical protein B1A34_03710 [Klebsiella pneumoniae]|nr:hypothetical protein [Klebsiella pneumoniae]ELA2415105.1 hypothetical protein [Klebsiella pneumoniae]
MGVSKEEFELLKAQVTACTIALTYAVTIASEQNEDLVPRLAHALRVDAEDNKEKNPIASKTLSSYAEAFEHFKKQNDSNRK